jgi:hypothetical protein
MKQTAVQWLVEQLENHNGVTRAGFEKCIKEALKMETKNKLERQLFIGKVSEIIGFEKTVELLKEAKQAIEEI